MANHPSRGWRSRMRHACLIWLCRAPGPPPDAVAGLVSIDELRQIRVATYEAGYTDGRESLKPKARHDPHRI